MTSVQYLATEHPMQLILFGASHMHAEVGPRPLLPHSRTHKPEAFLGLAQSTAVQHGAFLCKLVRGVAATTFLVPFLLEPLNAFHQHAPGLLNQQFFSLVAAFLPGVSCSVCAHPLKPATHRHPRTCQTRARPAPPKTTACRDSQNPFALPCAQPLHRRVQMLKRALFLVVAAAATLATVRPPVPIAGGAACPRLPFKLCPRLWDERHVPAHEADDIELYGEGLVWRENWPLWLLVLSIALAGLAGVSVQRTPPPFPLCSLHYDPTALTCAAATPSGQHVIATTPVECSEGLPAAASL